MYLIRETGVASVAIGGFVYVRDTAANSGVVSYWQKAANNLAAPHQYNDLHFTLGVILSDTAHFHATWHAQGAVSYYVCTASQVNGTLAVALDPGQGTGANVAMATALQIGLQIYESLYVDEKKLKEEREKLAARQKTAAKTGSVRVRPLFGQALSGITKSTTKTK